MEASFINPVTVYETRMSALVMTELCKSMECGNTATFFYLH